MKSLEKTGPVGKGERQPKSKAAKRKPVCSCGPRREKVDHLSLSERATGVQERGWPATATAGSLLPCSQTAFQEPKALIRPLDK